MSVTLSVVISFLFVATIVTAATTINENINTNNLTATNVAVSGGIDAVGNITSDSMIENIKYAILNRHYDEVVTVSSTITSALNSITDNSASKRYLLYIPDGTYNEENIQAKAYIDMVGESQDGVVIQSSSGEYDTVLSGGVNTMIANMTINHTNNIGDSGVYKYPIHADASSDGATPTATKNSTTIYYKLKINALGTNSKSGIGIGLHGSQRMYIVDCVITSAKLPAIYGHNVPSVTLPSEIYVINTIATGYNYGFLWNNTGSISNSDMIGIFGGAFSGGVSDIAVTDMDVGQYHGVGETYIYIDPYVEYSTSSFVDLDKLLTVPHLISIPIYSNPLYVEYTGVVHTSPSGTWINDDGIKVGTNYSANPPENGVIIEGNVGIGTNSPSAKLDVKVVGDGEAVRFGNTVGKFMSIGIQSSSAWLGYAGDQDMTILPSGNVGIGASIPNSKLEIAEDSAGNPIGVFIHNTAVTTLGNEARLSFGTWSSESFLGPGAKISVVNTYAGSGANEMSFFTKKMDGAISEKMIIDSEGNIGVGTTSPAVKLDVDGIIKTAPRSTATCNGNSEGGIYYDSDDNHFYGCNGSAWVQLDN